MARFAKLLMLLLIATLVVPGALDGGSDAVAKKKNTVKTRTFANPAFVSISAGSANGASDYPSEIRVRGFKKGKVKDVELKLRDFSHLNPDDVDVMLVAPGGRRAVVLADAGGGFLAHHIDLTLDDEAMGPPPDAAALSRGAFSPVNYPGGDSFVGGPAPTGDIDLATFNGTKANGAWRLFVYDDTDDNGGSLGEGWSLTITAKVKKDKKNKKKRK
jgi:subtilisin-like proprotein convertase family protein